MTDLVPRSTVPAIGDPPTWRLEAACRGVDPDLFFPERGQSTVEAKEICRACPVRAECLDYALVTGEKFGIWGGKSERERRRLRPRRRGWTAPETLSDERQRQIRSMHVHGLNAVEIGRELGISKRTVYRYLPEEDRAS